MNKYSYCCSYPTSSIVTIITNGHTGSTGDTGTRAERFGQEGTETEGTREAERQKNTVLISKREAARGNANSSGYIHLRVVFFVKDRSMLRI